MPAVSCIVSLLFLFGSALSVHGAVGVHDAHAAPMVDPIAGAALTVSLPVYHGVGSPFLLNLTALDASQLVDVELVVQSSQTCSLQVYFGSSLCTVGPTTMPGAALLDVSGCVAKFDSDVMELSLNSSSSSCWDLQLYAQLPPEIVLSRQPGIVQYSTTSYLTNAKMRFIMDEPVVQPFAVLINSTDAPVGFQSPYLVYAGGDNTTVAAKGYFFVPPGPTIVGYTIGFMDSNVGADNYGASGQALPGPVMLDVIGPGIFPPGQMPNDFISFNISVVDETPYQLTPPDPAIRIRFNRGASTVLKLLSPIPSSNLSVDVVGGGTQGMTVYWNLNDQMVLGSTQTFPAIIPLPPQPPGVKWLIVFTLEMDYDANVWYLDTQVTLNVPETSLKFGQEETSSTA
jgi:hypothetical protein